MGKRLRLAPVPRWVKGWRCCFCPEANARESRSRTLSGPPPCLPVCTQSCWTLAQQPFLGVCSEGVSLGGPPALVVTLRLSPK